ncbi:hypothetical protein RvY_02538 [Ramazzottius varieornatus]|uniref:Histone-lysine N-methyltransferase SETMAR n=1 Tax=Ramazzottius varieornatus TaxID=947166 RepID=A0A1D1UK38_RAMVA|nr:hypothetical protein RvY_02538 [Ramazzottius varieornatus]
MVTVWWTTRGVAHYNFLPPATTFNAEYYCRNLERMTERLAEKQPRLVSKDEIILLQHSARPHAAQITSAKIKEIGHGTSRSSSL